MSASFKPGDRVQLKSGGPAMTVERVEDGTDGSRIVCTWSEGAKRESRAFEPSALEIHGEDPLPDPLSPPVI
ncbi:MAG TPA: DUF2158 domain-containing protein [Microvirga sp.]|nr:DUF2158 domain-containing protein [Microvirga sp.]